MTLYRTLADQFCRLIESRTLAEGDKLPSVRALSRSRGLSVTTILEAYRLLEERGLIESRARSGFFIAHKDAPRAHRMQPANWLAPVDANVAKTMPQLISEAARPELLHLSVVNPHSEILPVSTLSRLTREVVRTKKDETTAYGESQGEKSLRRQIVNLMIDRGCATNLDDIVVTNGCQEALYLAFLKCLSPGEVVAVESPCYPGALQVLEALGHKVVETPSHSGSGIDLEALEKAAQVHGIRVVYVMPRVSNPLGATMPMSNLVDLYALAIRYDMRIIEDDTNWGLCFVDNHRPSLKSLDTENRVVYCSSFSKSLSPALRIGWLVGESLTSDFIDSKYVMNMGNAIIPQLVVSKYLAENRFSRDLACIRRAHETATRRLVAAINSYFPEGTHPIRPTGGFTVWTQLPAGVNSERLRAVALEERISIASGVTFSSRNGYQRYIRIGWGGEWSERVERGIETLGRLCRNCH